MAAEIQSQCVVLEEPDAELEYALRNEQELSAREA
jgi:hypothetical protein